MANHLANETSPYLLQHVDNPVDWYPWSTAALQLAIQTNKPILLSIGYSACHWCHVMAHESFEDEATANVMNRLFVNIKVDREERPDLDKIYQFAHQALTQRAGGWPLTMIITPDDHTPFFAGTYFPNQARYGMPSFVEVIQKVEQFYRDHKEDVLRQNDSLKQLLQRIDDSHTATGVVLSPMPLDEARRQLETSYDTQYGGFGKAPKFPHPGNITRLLCHWSATSIDGHSDKTALQMALSTLDGMARGGMNDLIGGGFCRYSVDDQWMIPHFEKMLYDNGPLLTLYAEAWAITGDAFYQRIARETADWVMREMQSPEGGYYSSLDADSEGHEGRYYVWTPQQVESLLSKDQYAIVARLFGLDRQANFEGKWHLHTYSTLKNVASELKVPVEDAEQQLTSARQQLLIAREQRIRPGRDEKILTSWNGLMIKGMAVAGRRLLRADLIQSAERALAFIRQHMWRSNRLLASYKDGKTHLNAYLDDYVFLADALWELLQARWRYADFQWLVELADAVLLHFQDSAHGGFYFTSHDHEPLLQRPKTLMDESLPSGYGVACSVLIRLGHVVGESRYLNAAEQALKAAWNSIQHTPYAHTSLLDALEHWLYPTQVIVIRGDGNELQQWQQHCIEAYAPRRLVLAIPNAAELPESLQVRKPGARTLAYVCEGHQCLAPLTDLAKLDEVLQKTQVLAQTIE